MSLPKYLSYPYSVLWFILTVAAILRLWNIGGESLWLDEAYTAFISVKSFGDILANYPLDVHPPLFYLLEHVSLVLQGSVSEFALRLFPALTGIAAIPMGYLIGKEAKNAETGLLLAAMLALSEFAIHYSREARMYSLILLFTMIALWCWMRYRNDPKPRYLMGFAVMSGLAIWTHFFAVLPFLALLLFLPRRLDMVEAVIITGAVSSPLALPALSMAHHQLSLTISGLTGFQVFNYGWWYLAGMSQVGYIVFGVLFVTGIVFLWERDRTLAYVTGLMFAGSFAFGIASSFVGVHQEARYYIYLLPLVFLAVIEGLDRIRDALRLQWWKRLIPVVVVLLILAVPLYSYYTTPQRDDWRAAEEITHGQPRIIIPSFNRVPMAYYSKDANETGVTYYKEIPDGFRGFVIVGPAGGYDPPLKEWFEGLSVYRNVTGVTIYKTNP